MTALIRTEPCLACDGSMVEADTGAFRCAIHYSYEDTCTMWRTARRVEDIAGQVAALYRHESDTVLRREMAQGAADGFANALFPQGMGAEFDIDAFLAACDLHPSGVRG